MTRQEILNEAILQLEAYGLAFDNTAGGNFHFAWLRMLDAVLDEYVNPFTVNFKDATTDLVSGQELYCPPDFKRIDQVFCQLEDDTWRELHPGDNGLLKTLYPNAFTDPQTGQPTHYITQGMNNRIVLYPTPDYNQTDGLRWEGFGNLLREDWPNPTSQCPLKRIYQPHLIDGLCYRMSATNPAISQFFYLLFLRHKATYNTDINAYTRWHRNRTGYGYPDGSRMIEPNPLDW